MFDRVQIEGLTWDWRSPPVSEDQVHNLNIISSKIGTFQPTGRLDHWKCDLSNDGKYHVDVLRQIIDHTQLAANEGVIPWIHEVPIKRRGVSITSTLCGYCSLADEDVDHILMRCHLASTGNCLKRSKNIISVCYGAISLIRKARCDWVPKKIRTSRQR
uniref:Reverse transcriptase zinc-binding domain-containing protein n=1 Tax=Lactuca sativa TaxID=4236 RepID=A0A9R1WYD0_LACSA|nr:hypothetical protein LSAT_V11C800399360 [Lactuca sativa]